MEFSNKKPGGEGAILITRELEGARSMADMVRSRGGTPLIFPTIETRCLIEEEMKEAFKVRLEKSTWVVLASPKAARLLPHILGESVKKHLSGKKIAAVGDSTRESIEESGLVVHLVPEQSSGMALGRALADKLGNEDIVFFPRALEGRRDIIEQIEHRGVSCDAIPLYETVMPSYEEGDVDNLLRAHIGYATFTSPSTFRNLLVILGKDSSERFFKHVKIAVIGETTASFVRERGYEVSVQPGQPRIEFLVEAIFKDQNGS